MQSLVPPTFGLTFSLPSLLYFSPRNFFPPIPSASFLAPPAATAPSHLFSCKHPPSTLTPFTRPYVHRLSLFFPSLHFWSLLGPLLLCPYHAPFILRSFGNCMAHLVDRTQIINWEDEQDGSDDTFKAVDDTSHRILIGKIISQRIINKQAMRDIVLHSWKSIDSLEVEDLGNNAFLFTFSTHTVRDQILSGGPWNVRGQMLILKPWNPNLSIGEIDLFYTPVWIQIHGLPMFKMTERSTKNIGQLAGPVLAHDFPANVKVHVSRFFRVQVMLDTRKPLIPGYYRKRQEAEPCWVPLKDEKISDFCYACGRIGHTQSACEV